MKRPISNPQAASTINYAVDDSIVRTLNEVRSKLGDYTSIPSTVFNQREFNNGSVLPTIQNRKGSVVRTNDYSVIRIVLTICAVLAAILTAEVVITQYRLVSMNTELVEVKQELKVLKEKAEIKIPASTP